MTTENKLTRLFKEKDLNISEFSRRSGVPYGTMYDIARGKTPFEKIGISTFIKIANEFGMSAEELLGEREVEPLRFELCQIFDTLSFDGRRALIACARGIEAEYEDDGWAEAKTGEELEA